MRFGIEYLFIFFLLIIVTSCIDVYRVEEQGYDDLLVVDGSISNAEPPYIIKLSRSSPIHKLDYLPVEHATVKIIDNNGIVEVLDEITAGEYHSSVQGMQGVIGDRYKLEIITFDGEQYQSGYEKINDTLSVGEVSAEVQDYVSDIDFKKYSGLQFYINNKFEAKDTNYYFLELFETYKYKTSYLDEYIYIGYIKLNPNVGMYHTCWKTVKINNIYTFSNSFQKLDKLKIPIHFVSSIGDELRIRYSLEVRQHTLSKSAFNYFDNLRTLVDDKRSLYTIQGYQINGNIKNLNNEEENVLGYFYASSFTNQRSFYNRPTGMIFKDKGCEIDYEAMRFISYLAPSNYPIPLVKGESGGIGRAYDDCIDCRAVGGDIFKPYFWKD